MLLCLAFVSQHSWVDSSILLCTRVFHSFIYGYVVLHFAYVARLTHFTIDGYVYCFQFEAMMHNNAINTLCRSSGGHKNS